MRMLILAVMLSGGIWCALEQTGVPGAKTINTPKNAATERSQRDPGGITGAGNVAGQLQTAIPEAGTASQWPAWIHAGAAVIQCICAIALWLVTVRLVRATRDMAYASVDPDLTMEIPTAGTDKAAESEASLVNSSACAVVELEVWTYAIVRYRGPSVSECGQIQPRLDDLDVPRKLPAGGKTAFRFLATAVSATEKAKSLSLNPNQRVEFTGLRFKIRCRQAITRKLYCTAEQYQIHVWPDGKLSLLFLDRQELNPHHV